MTIHAQETQSFILVDDGVFPNNEKLPLVILAQVFNAKSGNPAGTIEKLFSQNLWPSAWRNGLYGIHHYHSSAHEALGIYSGWVKAQFGGPEGKIATVRAGDVIIIPAGVSHKNLDQSPDFKVVGAYPEGQSPDMKYGRTGERPMADRRIETVPLPTTDPVFGASGPLMSFWR